MIGFLVAHGWENRRPAGHWQHWLAGELAVQGHAVAYPQFPSPDEPVLDEWLAEFRRHLAALDGDERVLVCHSLAVLLWWTAQPALGDLQPDRVLLVAPPSPDRLRREPAVAAFVPDGIETTPLDDDVRRRVRMVASDDDPYCPGGALEVYGRPHGLDLDVVPGGAHLDLPAGYGSWPAVLRWCTDPSVRITGR
ncbi:RBBP9/YdeN family alpha/beta hydrolase [Geodermatophilus sp. SYSU D01186]